MVSILHRLKTATAAQHSEIEEIIDVRNCGNTLGSYRNLIKLFYGVHAAWEPLARRQFDAALPGFFNSRRKVPLLEDDLLGLGLSLQDIRCLPRCDALADPRSFAATLGAAYVFEGSTLGGRILSRKFQEQLRVPATYFSSYGDNTGPMWSEFRDVVERFVAHTLVDDEVIEGATSTFAVLLRWFGDAIRFDTEHATADLTNRTSSD